MPSLRTLAEGTQTLAALAEGSGTLAALPENATRAATYPSLHTYPSAAATWPSVGNPNVLSLTPLQEV